LIALLPVLDEEALRAMYQCGDGQLKAACVEWLEQIRQAAEASRPRLVPVPDDGELAGHEDPSAALAPTSFTSRAARPNGI
jgi:hypothetical protein